MGRKPNPTGGLGAVLRDLREELGFTIEELADAAGLSAGYLSKIENNRVPLPRRRSLEALADLLGVRVEVLLGKSEGVPAEVVRAYRESPAAFVALARMTRREREAFARKASRESVDQLKKRLLK